MKIFILHWWTDTIKFTQNIVSLSNSWPRASMSDLKITFCPHVKGNNSHKKQQCLCPRRVLSRPVGAAAATEHRTHHTLTEEAWRGADLYVYRAIQEERKELNPLYACLQLRSKNKTSFWLHWNPLFFSYTQAYFPLLILLNFGLICMAAHT